MVFQGNVFAIDHHNPRCSLAPLGSADSSTLLLSAASIALFLSAIKRARPPTIVMCGVIVRYCSNQFDVGSVASITIGCGKRKSEK
jgi:hypothetical protein